MFKKLLSFISILMLSGSVFAQLTPTDSTISGHITANRTLSGKKYLISGWTYVDSTYKLTIKPGTILIGEKLTQGALIIKRGAQIFAEGTSVNPIIFTSQQPIGLRAAGDWGGVIICGAAPNNLGNPVIEGGVQAWHGGSNPADNSGIIRYCRIEFPGIPFAPNNEINGLTMGSVGSGTQIDHIQVSYSGDDSYEWFGGTVSCDHLIAWKGLDDDFDTDNGFSGTVQYGLGYRDPWIADQSNSEVFESDNDAAGDLNTPRTSVVFRNFTAIGPKETSTDANYNSKFYYGIHQRRATQQSIYNSIITGWPSGGVYVQDQAATDAVVSGPAVYNNVVFAGCSPSAFGNGTWTPTYANALAWFAAGTGNTTLAEPADASLVDPFNMITPNCRPTGASSNGAFSSSSDNWDAGWTNYDPQGINYGTSFDWLVPVIVKNSIKENRRIYFGVNSTATDGVDASLGEATLPAIPTQGIDLRWNLNQTALDIRNSSASGISSRTYPIKVTLGLTTGTAKIAWDNTKLPATGRFILSDGLGGILFANVDMRSQNSVSFSETQGSYTFTITHYIRFDRILVVKTGWNLMSYPGIRTAGSGMSPISNVFSQKDPAADAYIYTGSYSPITTLTPGQGFWMRCTTAANVSFTGSTNGLLYSTRTSTSVNAGWNILGVYEYNVTPSGLVVSPGAIDGLIYGYDPGTGYNVAGTLNYGFGYWAHLTAAGTITLPNTNLFYAKRNEDNNEEYFKADWGKIHIKDNKGAQYTLYSANNGVDLNFYKMPPLPPADLFDVRFASDRLVENLSVPQEIALQGVEFPITVTVENIKIQLKYDGKSYKLNSNQSVVLDGAMVEKISVSGENTVNSLPTEFSLKQNYPNPFNPTTNISFSIPSDSRVRITIYNSLGELVSELTNASYQAGRHDITWNATNATSGVYYYKLEAGSFVSIKKMMLVK
jgi:hypothetical protein